MGIALFQHIFTDMEVVKRNLFSTLPIELRQHVGRFLDSDQDLVRYIRVCSDTRDAVDGDACSFWRERFLITFEWPVWKLTGTRLVDNLKFKKEYAHRRSALKYGATFDIGQGSRERLCLGVLKDLITDAFSEKKTGDGSLAYESKNLTHILRFIDATNLLQVICADRPDCGYSQLLGSATPTTQLYHMIQLLLTPASLSFNDHLISQHYSFPHSQRLVYGTANDYPIFIGCNGLDVNMAWVLNVANFWKYHMVREEECTLFPAFSELDADERPQWWDQQLQTGTKHIGKHWKGSYAFIDRKKMRPMRAGKGEKKPIQDEMNGGDVYGYFQDLQLEFVEHDWPEVFERHLRSTTPPPSRAKTRAQHRSSAPDAAKLPASQPISFQFQGEGHDQAEDFVASGWLNPLPAQCGVPGWQRMTMMKYAASIDDDQEIDEDALWAYEGVVLPGGNIMLGRWWSPQFGTGEEMYSGPFILWCVDGPKYADEGEGESVGGSMDTA